MRKLREDSATSFLRALRARFADSTARYHLDELASRSWASVTFCGARHRVSFTLEGPGAAQAADDFVRTIAEAEFDLRDHLLADISLLGEERSGDGERVRINLEALTVEDS